MELKKLLETIFAPSEFSFSSSSRKRINIHIRRARSEEAGEISRAILAALRETNCKDYSPQVIRQVEPSFSPAAVFNLITDRTMFVAMFEDQLVGTASLDGQVVRTVFVSPEFQGQGVGRLLMAQIDQTAQVEGITRLTVASSVTAEQFYCKLGFKAMHDSYHGAERTIIMERNLAEP